MEVIGFSQVITMMGSFLVVILLLATTLFGIKKYSAVMGISGKGEAAVRRAAAEAGDEARDEGVDAAISGTGR